MKLYKEIAKAMDEAHEEDGSHTPHSIALQAESFLRDLGFTNEEIGSIRCKGGFWDGDKWISKQDFQSFGK